MCLRVKKFSKLKKAKKDIIVYKVAVGINSRFYSYYQFSEFEPYQVLTVDKKSFKNQFILKHSKKNQIHYGFHSFIEKKDAINLGIVGNASLFECIIPAGSYYIEGLFDGTEKSIVSNKLKYNKILDGVGVLKEK